MKPVNPASQRTGPQATVQVMAESPDAPETESFGTNLYESRGECWLGGGGFFGILGWMMDS